ncbi:hypothetical protein SBDP1_720004 [Syntrophobacter sp. SbD1]|nr:hypothetical protein SBDP1_720004 [Syntrophobacter sp. SbD1]
MWHEFLEVIQKGYGTSLRILVSNGFSTPSGMRQACRKPLDLKGYRDDSGFHIHRDRDNGQDSSCG